MTSVYRTLIIVHHIYSKLVTVVIGNTKAFFSIATTPRCRGRRYSFPRITLLTLDPYLIMLTVKQISIKNHFFLVFGMTRPVIEPRHPGPLANALLCQWAGIGFIPRLNHTKDLNILLYIYIYIYPPSNG